jgi:hypothetical protein
MSESLLRQFFRWGWLLLIRVVSRSLALLKQNLQDNGDNNEHGNDGQHGGIGESWSHPYLCFLYSVALLQLLGDSSHKPLPVPRLIQQEDVLLVESFDDAPAVWDAILMGR